MSSGSESGADEEDKEVADATDDDDDDDDDKDDKDGEEAADEDENGDDDDEGAEPADISEPESTLSPRQSRESNPAIAARCNCSARQHIASIGHCSCGALPKPLAPPLSWVLSKPYGSTAGSPTANRTVPFSFDKDDADEEDEKEDEDAVLCLAGEAEKKKAASVALSGCRRCADTMRFAIRAAAVDFPAPGPPVERREKHQDRQPAKR